MVRTRAWTGRWAGTTGFRRKLRFRGGHCDTATGVAGTLRNGQLVRLARLVGPPRHLGRRVDGRCHRTGDPGRRFDRRRLLHLTGHGLRRDRTTEGRRRVASRPTGRTIAARSSGGGRRINRRPCLRRRFDPRRGGPLAPIVTTRLGRRADQVLTSGLGTRHRRTRGHHRRVHRRGSGLLQPVTRLLHPAGPVNNKRANRRSRRINRLDRLIRPLLCLPGSLVTRHRRATSHRRRIHRRSRRPSLDSAGRPAPVTRTGGNGRRLAWRDSLRSLLGLAGRLRFSGRRRASDCRRWIHRRGGGLFQSLGFRPLNGLRHQIIRLFRLVGRVLPHRRVDLPSRLPLGTRRHHRPGHLAGQARLVVTPRVRFAGRRHGQRRRRCPRHRLVNPGAGIVRTGGFHRGVTRFTRWGCAGLGRVGLGFDVGLVT